MTPSGFRVERLGVRPVRRAAFPLPRSVVASLGRGSARNAIACSVSTVRTAFFRLTRPKPTAPRKRSAKPLGLGLGNRREVWLLDRLIGRIGYPQP